MGRGSQDGSCYSRARLPGGQQYTVRLSVSGYNLTNHFNPEAFHNNVADPAYGLFFGQRGRRFTADFDVIF